MGLLALGIIRFVQRGGAEVDTPLLVLEHLTGDILGQPRPVAVVVVKVIVKELDDLRLEADKAVGRPGMIGAQANVLHDGIAAEDGFLE